MGAVVTCPLDVVKTRLQSSSGVLPPQECSTASVVNNNGGSIKTAAGGDMSSSNHHCSTNFNKNSSSPGSASMKKSRFFNSFLYRNVPALNYGGAAGGQKTPNLLPTKPPPQSRSYCAGMSAGKNGAVRDLMGLHLWRHLKDIVKNEGFGALFRGLGPTLVGVAPSRYVCNFYIMNLIQ